jgi:hypothetical protein
MVRARCTQLLCRRVPATARPRQAIRRRRRSSQPNLPSAVVVLRHPSVEHRHIMQRLPTGVLIAHRRRRRIPQHPRLSIQRAQATRLQARATRRRRRRSLLRARVTALSHPLSARLRRVTRRQAPPSARRPLVVRVIFFYYHRAPNDCIVRFTYVSQHVSILTEVLADIATITVVAQVL